MGRHAYGPGTEDSGHERPPDLFVAGVLTGILVALVSVVTLVMLFASIGYTNH